MIFYRCDLRTDTSEIPENSNEKKDFICSIRTKTVIKQALDFYKARKQNDFGNGRFVRNLMEKAQMKQASRLVQMDMETIKKSDLTMLRAEDFESPPLVKSEKHRIGFC